MTEEAIVLTLSRVPLDRKLILVQSRQKSFELPTGFVPKIRILCRPKLFATNEDITFF